MELLSEGRTIIRFYFEFDFRIAKNLMQNNSYLVFLENKAYNK